MKPDPGEIIIKVLSFAPWSTEVWNRLFPEMERLIGTPLDLLDERDPMRRKVNGGIGQGDYLCDFTGKKTAVVPSGRFGKSKVWFMAWNNRFPSGIENQLNLFIPVQSARKLGLRVTEEIFDLIMTELKPFYQVCDAKTIVYSRQPSPPCTTVHHSLELSGVYWLTYFGPKYRAFFGDDRFRALPHEWTEEGGVKLKLGDDPWLLEDEKRRAAEKALGELTFASYGENKKENEHVIPWPELLEGDWIAEYQRREAAGIKPWEFG